MLSCSKNNVINMFPAPEINLRKQMAIDYKIDTLLMDTTMNSTFEGHIGVHDGKLYFIDYLFCTIHFFDTTGKIIFKTLGIGRGPTETTIGQIYTHTFLFNKNKRVWHCCDWSHSALLRQREDSEELKAVL